LFNLNLSVRLNTRRVNQKRNVKKEGRFF